MRGIGGNITGVLQIKTAAQNAIGETVNTWSDAVALKGWLDLTSGNQRSTVISYEAKIAESTHVFVCDFCDIGAVTEDNSRMVICGKRYEVLKIDNPMEMRFGSQLEIYLKYIGGQQ